MQAPQIYGKSKRADRNTIARRSAGATVALANGVASYAKTGAAKKTYTEGEDGYVDPLRISYDQIRPPSVEHRDSDDALLGESEEDEDEDKEDDH